MSTLRFACLSFMILSYRPSNGNNAKKHVKKNKYEEQNKDFKKVYFNKKETVLGGKTEGSKKSKLRRGADSKAKGRTESI
jgi:hypothetical protein